MGKLSSRAFQTFLELVASEFTGDGDEAIDNLVEFLTASVERSHTEYLQSLTRRKWLRDIQQAAETSGASMEAVYKAVFKALSQVGIPGSTRIVCVGIVTLTANPHAFEWDSRVAWEAGLRLVSLCLLHLAGAGKRTWLRTEKVTGQICNTRILDHALPIKGASPG